MHMEVLNIFAFLVIPRSEESQEDPQKISRVLRLSLEKTRYTKYICLRCCFQATMYGLAYDRFGSHDGGTDPVG